jgi:HEAT repeat protein
VIPRLLCTAALAAAAAAGGEVPPDVRRRLDDPDPKVRGDGLKALRGNLDEAAAKAAVAFLDDRDPACRDYAAWILCARATDPAAVKWIVERAPRAGTPAGRLAAADALAALADPSSLGGLEALGNDRDPRVRETVIDGIARKAKAADPAAARVRAALADGAPGPRAAALEALARWKAPEAADAAATALGDPDPGVRTAAVAALAAGSPERFGAEFPRLAADPDWGVRWTAALHAPLLAAAPPVESLAALLEDPRMRVADGAHDALRGISGLDLPPLRKDWADWWNGARAGWKGRPRARPSPAARPSVAAWHGLPFRSDHVIFCVDLSGSMEQPLGAVDRRPRIQVAAEELSKTLGALPDRARADVLAFMLEPERALGKGAELKGGTRDRLRRWFDRRDRGRKGDLGGGLLAAVLDGEADTVLFLGDGAASAGECLYRERIQERFRQALRRRPVALHAVAFGARPPDRQFLEALAALAGGTCTER